MICSPSSRGEEEFSFSDCPVIFLCSQMHSGLSVLVFGLVTAFNKEVPDLTFRVHDNSHFVHYIAACLSIFESTAPLSTSVSSH